MKKTKSRQPSENEITDQIIKGLELKNFRCFKIYNGGVPARCEGSRIIYKKKPLEYKGVPDLLAISKKRKQLLFIEVKSPTGKPSKEQLEFIDLIQSVEFVDGLVAYNFDQVDKLIH